MERYLEFALNHYLLSLALLVVTVLLIQDFFESAFKKFKSVSPLQAVTKMNQGDVVIVDVREPAEFKQKHIENAINAPLGTLSEQLPSLAGYKNQPVLISCETGARSATAGRVLAKAGFEQVFVITGGMQAWENDYKLPIKTTKKAKA